MYIEKASYFFIRSGSAFTSTNILDDARDFCLVLLQVRVKDPFQFSSIATDGCSKGERVGDHFTDRAPRVVKQVFSVSCHVDI